MRPPVFFDMAEDSCYHALTFIILPTLYLSFKPRLLLPGKNLNAEHREVAAEEQKQRIRDILGVEELTKMRRMLVKEAPSFLEEKN